MWRRSSGILNAATVGARREDRNARGNRRLDLREKIRGDDQDLRAAVG